MNFHSFCLLVSFVSFVSLQEHVSNLHLLKKVELDDLIKSNKRFLILTGLITLNKFRKYLKINKYFS